MPAHAKKFPDALRTAELCAVGALSLAQQLQPETLDIEAQAPVKVGKDEADMIKCLGPQGAGSGHNQGASEEPVAAEADDHRRDGVDRERRAGRLLRSAAAWCQQAIHYQ